MTPDRISDRLPSVLAPLVDEAGGMAIVADRSGVGLTTVHRLLKGGSCPALDTLEALCRGLGTTVPALYLRAAGKDAPEPERLAHDADRLEAAADGEADGKAPLRDAVELLRWLAETHTPPGRE